MNALDLRLLYILNHWVGRNTELDSILRFMALWGVTWAAWEVGRPWIKGQSLPDCLRSTRDALLSASTAFLFSFVLTHLHTRARPFLSYPVTMLYVAPNNACFPDIVTALGVGMTLGAIRRDRSRWLPAGVVTSLWVLARMASGTMFPLDAVVGVIIGAIPVACEATLDKIPYPRSRVRAGAVAVGALVIGLGWISRSHLPKIPPMSTTQEKMSLVRANGPVRPVPDNRLKGFMIPEERRALSVLDELFPPPPVERVEVGSNTGIKVAGVKLLAGDHWDFRSRKVTEWHAARAIKALLLKDPELAEIDLWAVIPFKTHQGKEALRPVLFVQARRTRGHRIMLATPRQILWDSEKLLGSLGEVYALHKEFPQPGVTLPNGVAEGAG